MEPAPGLLKAQTTVKELWKLLEKPWKPFKDWRNILKVSMEAQKEEKIIAPLEPAQGPLEPGH